MRHNLPMKNRLLYTLGAPVVAISIGLLVGGAIRYRQTRIPVPPLYFKDGVWYTDGSREMVIRAMGGCQLGESVLMHDGSYHWGNWDNGGTIKVKAQESVTEIKSWRVDERGKLYDVVPGKTVVIPSEQP